MNISFWGIDQNAKDYLYQWKFLPFALVEINQNIIIPFMTTCNLQLFVIRFENICTIRPTFNYYGRFHNYDTTIRNFILLVASILHLFPSINRLICLINHNNHQISCILNVFYNDIEVYFIVYTKIIYISYAYICILFIKMNILILNIFI